MSKDNDTVLLRLFFISVFLITFCSGCAATQQKLVDRLVYGSGKDLPKFEFAAGTRVGIINLVDKQLTHKNFQAFSKKGTFIRKYDVDWNLPGSIENYIKAELRKDGRYEIVSLPVPASLQMYANEGAQISGLYREPDLGKIRTDVDRLARENNLQVVIIAGNHILISNDNSLVAIGYGIYTGRGYVKSLTKIFGEVYAFAGIGVQVYHTEPLTYIGGGRPSIPYYAEFPWHDDPSSIPVSDFDAIKPIIEGESQKIAMRALQQANLLEASP